MLKTKTAIIIFLITFSGIIFFTKSSLAVEPFCPGGISPDPNVVFCEDFESWNNQRWEVGSNGERLSRNDFVRTDKKIHGNYGAWTGQQLFDGHWGTWGYNTERCWEPELSEMYIRWYTYISPDYVFGSGEDKLFLLHDCGRTISHYVYTSRPFGGEHGDFGTGIPGACIYQDCDWDEGSPCDGFEWVNRGLNLGNNITLQPGRTYLFEWYLKLNTPGQRNGIMKLWVDDVTDGNPQNQTLRMDYSNIRYLRTGDAGKKFGRLRLTVYSQRKYQDEPASRYMTWDNIVVSRMPIGPIKTTTQPDTTPPSPPTGVMVI